MFMRKKGPYHYLVESARIDGRVVQRTVAYLGPFASVEEALAKLPGIISEFEAKAEKRKAERARLVASLPECWREKPPRPDARRYRYGGRNMIFFRIRQYQQEAEYAEREAKRLAAWLAKLTVVPKTD